ncbi:MAG: hypothetical protein Q9181_005839, partial [Wetmoreana brouardii]
SSNLNNSANPPSTIQSPLDPSGHPQLSIPVQYDQGNVPSGGELVASIATRIYYCWKEEFDVPIIRKQTHRYVPFPDFLYSVEPSMLPEASLTPLKVGIGYIWVLDGMWKLRYWPGFIRAQLYEPDEHYQHGLFLGYLSIQNSPMTVSAASSDDNKTALAHMLNFTNLRSDEHASRPSALDADGIVERSWFECFASMLIYIVKFPVQGSVADEMRPGFPSITYFFSCSTTDPRMRVEMTIFPGAAAQSPHRLTWDALVKTMLIWATNVAENRAWSHANPTPVYDGLVHTATIAFAREANAETA